MLTSTVKACRPMCVKPLPFKALHVEGQQHANNINIHDIISMHKYMYAKFNARLDIVSEAYIGCTNLDTLKKVRGCVCIWYYQNIVFIGNPIELFSSILSFAYHVVLYVILDNVALINSTQIVREIILEKNW